jgi:hypothetical protein
MWESVAGLEWMFWLLAVPATLVFAIQALLMLVGVTVDHSEFHFFGHGAEGHGYSPIFTVRNLVVFFMIFGWTGIAMVREYHAGTVVALAVSTLAGVFMMGVVTLMFYGISRLSSSGNYTPDDSLVGQEASVYLRIPAKRGGNGKIIVMAGGRKREFLAQTHGEEIATNTMVRIR